MVENCQNDDMTESIPLGSKSFLNNVNSFSLQIGSHTVHTTTHAWNIGAIMDNTMHMQLQINNTCKGAWSLLRKIEIIKKYLSLRNMWSTHPCCHYI